MRSTEPQTGTPLAKGERESLPREVLHTRFVETFSGKPIVVDVIATQPQGGAARLFRAEARFYTDPHLLGRCFRGETARTSEEAIASVRGLLDEGLRYGEIRDGHDARRAQSPA
jgi:hypothetical protein